jgi:ABC-2 type transport system permease protein
MVYDREMGTMRLLMTAPFPRALLLLFRLISTGLIGVLQVYAFLLVAMLMGIEFEILYLLFVAPLLLLVAILFGALGFLLSLTIRQLENFAGVMNFVIFPSFFLSSALYPLWRIQESSPLLAEISYWNPFTHAVEAIRYQLYGDFKTLSVIYLVVVTVTSLLTVMFAYAKRDVMKIR